MVLLPLLGLPWPPVVSVTAPSKTSEASSQSPVSLHVRSRSSLGRSSALFGYFWDALGDFWSTFDHFWYKKAPQKEAWESSKVIFS